MESVLEDYLSHKESKLEGDSGGFKEKTPNNQSRFYTVYRKRVKRIGTIRSFWSIKE